ncbi:MAG: ABC-F family ATP-binding cassette domain-containing protein [Candidatus Cloacimonetes bacterium]|nr:ABC-F family ATP-binding cassette domain-containing protein [Candidatus Cloacimonadota bacterium]
MTARENIISFEEVEKSFGEKPIINKISFGIDYCEKIGLIGINGCGKSTFLKILAGLEHFDYGNVTFRNGLKIAYLPQIPSLNPQLTVFEQIYYSDNEGFNLLRRYHLLNSELEKNYCETTYKELQSVTQQIERGNYWKVEVKAKKFLNILGFTELNQNVTNLSGGEQRRIDLARVLMDEPDLLILDEPTNHLDIDTIEWIQDYLKNYKGTVIFVTHDRYFLDDVSDRIMEIEDGIVRFYKGCYSDYLNQKQLQMTDLMRKETRRSAQLQKELKWLQRGAKARSTKPKNHVERVKELLDKSYISSEKELDISFTMKRMGKTILEIQGVSKNYQKELFSSFTHTFQKTERIGVIGNNGCGKTTMLKIITDEIKPDKGKVKVGLNTHFAYFRQNTDEFDQNISVIDYIRQQAEFIRTKDGVLHSATEMLQRFLFDGKMQQAKIKSLSGGEKKRLYLLKSLMFGSNFMILDEPTNDLDLRTLEILEDYLDTYEGCLLVVSHDRYFLDRVVDYLFIFENGQIRKFPGNYSDYLLVKRFQDEQTKESDPNSSKQNRVKEKSNKLTFNEKRELEELKKRITVLETRQEELNNQIETQAANLASQDFSRIADELTKNEEDLELLIERWAELAEREE